MNITKTPWFLVFGLALGAAACGDDDSGSGTNNAASGGVQAACEAYVAKYCEQMVVPCYSVSQSECVSKSQRTLPGGSCAGAYSVGPTYDACMEDLEAMTCSAKDPPESCATAIMIEASAETDPEAPAGCEAFVAKYCEAAAPCESASQSECVSQVERGFADEGRPCSGADRLGDRYDECMVDLGAMTCGAGLPSSCKGVLLFN